MIGERLRVHYNLQRGDLSVVDPRAGRVICNVDSIVLTDVEFRVGEKMRQWTIAHHRRKVMAYGIGIVESVNDAPAIDDLLCVTYNPFRAGCFHVKETSEPVWRAQRVVFSGAYCYIDKEDRCKQSVKTG